MKVSVLQYMRSKKPLLITVAIQALILASSGLVMVFAVAVINADMYGRLSETQKLGQTISSPNPNSKIPVLRLVIHRLLPDENAVEASVVLTADQSLLDDLGKRGEPKITCVVHDASNYQPIALANAVVLEQKLGYRGWAEVSAQSERFKLSALPSVNGFPFDDIQIEAYADVLDAKGDLVPSEVEVQKALPGRRLKASLTGGRESIVLTRSWTEKTLILTSSLIFILICLLVAGHLFSAKTRLQGVEQIFAIAGFLVAAGGFRSVLNFPIASGTTALEVAVIGVPLVVLALGFAVSAWRALRDPERTIDTMGSPESKK